MKFQNIKNSHRMEWCGTHGFFEATYKDMAWCRYYHQEGHTKYDCKQSKAQIICYYCYGNGHRAIECPRKSFSTSFKKQRKISSMKNGQNKHDENNIKDISLNAELNKNKEKEKEETIKDDQMKGKEIPQNNNKDDNNNEIMNKQITQQAKNIQSPIDKDKSTEYYKIYQYEPLKYDKEKDISESELSEMDEDDISKLDYNFINNNQLNGRQKGQKTQEKNEIPQQFIHNFRITTNDPKEDQYSSSQ
ncbi:unnamed protein product [Cunninghamella blakesleeana]